MGKSKKVFIDRKNATTFHLVHRSQRDPLITDETAPQHVLVEAAPRQQAKQEAEPDNIGKRREEQRKYGIFFDDDYNYLQHLKTKKEDDVVWETVENPNHMRRRTSENAEEINLNLPSSVFASAFEEDEGMLNKAAKITGPRPDWDPDIVAALDGDFESGDELEDDFFLKAGEIVSDSECHGEGGKDDDEEEGDWQSENLNEDDSENGDRLGPLISERRFSCEETKSRFTEYSMSSSVINRNEQLTLLDNRFERFYASYDDPELGDLVMEDIEGTWHQKHPYIMNCFKELKKSDKTLEYNREWDRERIKKYANVNDGDTDIKEELIEYEVDDKKQKKWDCESILSKNSNIYNHPKVIEEPRRNHKSSSILPANVIEIDPKTGLPTNVLRGGIDGQLSAKALAHLNDNSNTGTSKSLCDKSVISTLSVLSIRPKDELPEEKRERKRLLKEYRTERRIEKKANSAAFKEEKKRLNHNKKNSQQLGSKIL